MTELKLSDGNYIIPQVTRCDVIVDGERIQHSKIELSLSVQDDGRTLKVFIDTSINLDDNEETIVEQKFEEILNNMIKEKR